MPQTPEQDPRIYFAAERTLLAWIRTGLAMMGFGFVVARFGLFLREMQAIRPGDIPQSPRLSLWFGTALVLLGVLANASAAFRHARLVGRLRAGTWDGEHSSHLGIAVAVALAVVGVAVTVYLFLMH